MNVAFGNLRQFCARAFETAGMSAEHAELCADALVMADAMGFRSHGTSNVNGYVSKALAGGVDFAAQPSVEVDLPSLAQIDARNALGIVPSAMAMELACDKAERTGIAMVSVKNSSHFGAAGYYANIAAKRGLFGLVMSNVDANMAIPGSSGKAMGNNPISFAAPAPGGSTVFLDISTSSTASLKVIQARQAGESVPDGWIVDKDGRPTNDPSRYPEEGALQSMAMHKGYGLSVMVECLTGILTGTGTSASGSIPSWCFALPQPNNVSHAFIAIDIMQIEPRESYLENMARFLDDVHRIPTVAGVESLHVPGEGAWARYRQALDEGVELPEATVSSLRAIAETLAIPFIAD